MWAKRHLSYSMRYLMPYKPSERPPLTPQQQKLYPQVQQEFTQEGYPILKFKRSESNMFNKRKPRRLRTSKRSALLRPRELYMKEDQDWPSIWPTAKTFVPSSVPLPIKQSYEEKRGSVPLGKYLNTELIKIPNFLHLTPKAIERQCNAIRKFCTEWPEGLSSDEEVRSHFPVTYVTRDYVHSSSTIRDVRARIVELQINIDDLKLDKLDREKLILLARHRYDQNTGILTISVGECPMRAQNKDYADYLLTALYFESIKHDDWEFDESSKRIK